MVNIICLSIFFLLQISTLACADQKEIKIATLEDYAPFCMTNGEFKTNQRIQVGRDAVGFEGYSWDVLRQSLHEMGYTIDLYVLPWVRALNYLEAGKVDALFPTGKNSEREKIFYYSREPVNEVVFVLYLRAEDPTEWRGFDLLKGLRIGVKRGFNYGDEWNAAIGIKKRDMGTILQGFEMLKAERLDGFLGYEHSWDYVLKKKNWKGRFKKFHIQSSSLEYLVVLKSNPRGRQFLNAFDIGKKRVVGSGQLENIKSRWFGN